MHPTPDPATVARLVSSRRLQLIIMPTERCNCRCVYCYETFGHGRMAAGTVAGAKALLATRAPELNQLSLVWFGGEPLLAPDIVLDISGHAQHLAEQHPQMHYSGSMTTNGYLLTPALRTKLAQAGIIHYQITLDGPAPVHDRRRPLAGGGPTFERIWSNLRALRDSDDPATVTLRLHYEAGTAAKLAPLLEALRREFLPDRRFHVRFKAVERLGGANDDAIQYLPHEEEQTALQAFRRLLYGEGHTDPVDEPYICYAAYANSLVIRANGDVNKCTVALQDPRNCLGHLRGDGSLSFLPGRLAPWLRGLETLNWDQLGCPWKHISTA